jgi:hypothetical protein
MGEVLEYYPQPLGTRSIIGGKEGRAITPYLALFGTIFSAT